MKCFYHNDNDGICAAFWVSYFTKNRKEDEYIPMCRGDIFPLEIIKEDEWIYIVDYAIDPEEMEKLLRITKNVVWIDHHGTAIAKYEGAGMQLDGLRKDGTAACLLTYAFFKHMDNGKNAFKEEFLNDAPMFTKYIGDNDVWKFEYGSNTRFFSLAFPMLLPTDEIWFQMLENEEIVDEYVKNGACIQEYSDSLAASYCKELGFEVEFKGYKCFAVNKGFCNSAFFKSVDSDKYDILIPFYYNGRFWSYSLFSQKVDVGAIAKQYPGGGGHRDAAGFETEELIF